MRKTFLIWAMCALAVVACSAAKDPKDNPSSDPSKEPVEEPTADPSEEPVSPSEEPSVDPFDSWNGHYVIAISDAYEVFEETDALPNTVNVEGLNYGKGQYMAAACQLITRIKENPDSWYEEDVDENKFGAGGGNVQGNTWDRNVITLDEVLYLVEKAYNYAKGSNAFPNYVTMEGEVDIVGTSHPRRITAENYYVILARVLHYFKENGSLPEEVSSWPSDYLHSTNNCPVENETVIATMQEAIKGCTTDREKAEAIFAYTRDEWEWENYMNTKKGAVGTINAKGGNCCDLTHATLAMCRAAGIPARYLHGQCYFASGVIGHVIPEIYAEGEWWICDPSNNSATWGVPTWKGMETFNGRYVELPF